MNKIAVVVGSNRKNSVSRRIAHWLAPKLTNLSQLAEVVDLAEENLPWLDEPKLPAQGDYQMPSTIAWSDKIQSYDAVVFVAPQYNWGYPAVLKNAMDTLYSEWQDLPVATVFFGGHGGFQEDLAFSLILQGLKVRRLPTNLSLNISVGQITAEMTDDQVDVVLSEFDKEVSQLSQTLSDLV
ncbi:flavoprotein [Fructobacillus pseudoficulneus]|uniref:Flavoprotein n=1 Tax=Fructobacillus pseudoficulneus TaxID=220714 RepID=A0A3F3GW59_9LACO|nr:NADPH-dependent FMN reductase [Fructobacillus pseudoficulneus]GAP03044.1 flavoprotein [Fructobacillus pseudoficulneus]SEH41821.1 NAD(P)H-dependent FMN reductase [Fructobacillus pseudoficulneus]